MVHSRNPLLTTTIYIHSTILLPLFSPLNTGYESQRLQYNMPVANTHGRHAYAISSLFYGIIDCVAILPFVVIYLYKETPHVHLVVLAYVLIIFKLIRYSRSFQMIGTVLKTVREELITAYTACGIMLGFSGILMYYIERNAQPEAFENIGDGFWWAIVAFTTVGYGDIYPITPLGRLLSSIISLIGIAMIAIPTGIISSAFMNMLIEKKQKENNESTK